MDNGRSLQALISILYMINNKALGLARLTEPEHRKEIEENLNICFDDLYDMLGGVRKNVEQLDELLDRVLYGVTLGEPMTSNRPSNRLTL